MSAPIFVTAATGEEHIRLAENLDQSFADNGWPRLIVVTDEPCRARENVVEKDDLWKGRGLKTRFAEFVPDDHQGDVYWVDADCLAKGPFIEPDVELGPGELQGIYLRQYEGGKFAAYCSAWLRVGDLATARDLCSLWHKYTNDRPRASRYASRTDEIGLFLAAKKRRSGEYVFKPVESSASIREPMPNLEHLNATNGKENA